MREVAAAALGGALGSLARWSLTLLLPAAATAGFPWTILVVNVVGATVLAALRLPRAVRDRRWLAVFLGTGVCGGFTTMSTASADAVALLLDGRLLATAAYVLGTLGGALAGVAAVHRLGRRGSAGGPR